MAGINIMLLFLISLIFIPCMLSFLSPPKPHHLKYLNSKLLTNILLKLEKWSLYHQQQVYLITGVITLIAVAGIFRLKSEAFIVDDLPENE